jgi:putative Holliday junction resolvase
MDEVKFYLGIDWGKAKIGLSLADSHNKMAMPFRIVKSLEEVLIIIKQEDVSTLIVGKPLALSGGADKFTAGFARFVADLARAAQLPIELVDERFSTKQADQLLKGHKKKGKHEDAVVAMIILQSWLDKI